MFGDIIPQAMMEPSEEEDVEFFHINDLSNKSAAGIAAIALQSDIWHGRIARAADMLVKQERGHFRYGGQYQDGSTLWLDEYGNGELVEVWEPIYERASNL
jgi:hypothetical protein